ncbi:MAG TPA: hypothetical protein VGQ36_24945 [Thermoanaerobaculia bacterium]|jgi:hypothetical protein|nr:hypothetical protein [Thermoanaerobaculia bacterium]
MTFTIELDADSKVKISKLVGQEIASIHCESVPFARERLADGTHSPLFPGWREMAKWSIVFNKVPFWTIREEAKQRWAELRTGKTVRVRGALVVDTATGLPVAKSVEIHPIYEIAVH